MCEQFYMALTIFLNQFHIDLKTSQVNTVVHHGELHGCVFIALMVFCFKSPLQRLDLMFVIIVNIGGGVQFSVIKSNSAARYISNSE